MTGKGKLIDTGKEDKQCNIYDMAGNLWEWTTESGNEINPCNARGGNCRDTGYYTCIRYGTILKDAHSYRTFRPILYL